MTGAAALSLLSVVPAARVRASPSFGSALERARELPQLHSLLVAQEGEVVLAEALNGAGLDQPVNIKSLAKTLLSALVGSAIDRKLLEGPDQPIAPLLQDRLPAEPDPRLNEITLGNLLSMQAGLERTSGPNYGRWVNSADWVSHALSRPFVDEPGGRMLYSSGNSHLLSAILTKVSGESTLSLARRWLGEPLEITIPPWQRDPQGIYFGGNNMLMSPRALLRFGECYRNGGVFSGRHVVSEAWIEESWRPRTRSRFTGHDYGYGWFKTRLGGLNAYYGWGFGGQLLHVIPEAELTVVMTSDPTARSGGRYVRSLHGLVADHIVPAAIGRESHD